MGFLSKIRNRVKKQIRPNNMMIGNIRKMPRRGGGFLGKIRDKAFDRIESGKIPARSGFLRGQYFGPRGNMGSDFRMPQIGDMRFRDRLPQKNTAFSEAVRKLKKQLRNQQPIPERMPINRFKDPIKRPERMPSMDDGRVYAGGAPGLYKPGGRF